MSRKPFDPVLYERSRARQRRELSQWLSRNPLSAWHDPTVMRSRVRASDGMTVLVRSGGAEIRAMATRTLVEIPPPSHPYDDSGTASVQIDLPLAPIAQAS